MCNSISGFLDMPCLMRPSFCTLQLGEKGNTVIVEKNPHLCLLTLFSTYWVFETDYYVAHIDPEL